ncbi:MAG: HK97 gp10 family phage protein [Burkholderiales bacterium]
MITLQLEGDERVVANIDRMSKAVKEEMRLSIGALTLKLAARVKLKLSDDVLHVRTGRLRRSITTETSEEGGGVHGKVGTNVEYARFQEYGFKGTQTVKQSLRTITQAFGKPLKGPMQITVGAHQRRIDYPEHSFLRSALREMNGEITDELNQALKRAIT